MPEVRLLIADDDPVYLALGSEEMAEAGFRVETARNGEDALRRLQGGGFDLLICDFEMPDIDGPALLERLRSGEGGCDADLPVIMVTGRDDTLAIAQAFESGATSFVQKPVNWLVLKHHAEFVLRANKAAEQVRNARDLALKASRGKDSLMMALRHELRSPLHVIQGFASLLRGQTTDCQDRAFLSSLEFIENGVTEMIDKMDKLFMYSEILNRTLSIGRDEVDLLRLLNRARERAEQLSSVRGVTVRILKRSEERMTLLGDEEKLQIAFAHLIDNALKFSPPDGTVLVTASAGPDTLEVVVTDDGEGFDLERCNDYLTSFGQGDSGLTRESTGVGLGLTVCDYIVHAHKGRLELGNDPAGGAMVCVTLPRAQAKRSTEAA